MAEKELFRKTDQFILSITSENTKVNEGYNIFPSHHLSEGKIFRGFEQLFRKIMDQKVVLIDGFQGVYFENIVHNLTKYLNEEGKTIKLFTTYEAMYPQETINSIIAPYLGGEDPLFGKVTNLHLLNFFDENKLNQLKRDNSSDITIIYGPGAFMTPDNGLKIYIDLPKNELQYRARAQSITNLGNDVFEDEVKMYKRSYFVDWPVLNRHKALWAGVIDIIADGQHIHDIVFASGEDIRKGLYEISRNVLRVRPWFEPGVWGGHWMLNHIEGLNKKVKNYAWSFEYISPENGIIFTTGGLNLEISFDFLMYLEGKSILGADFSRFQYEFPIRFDFLDTFDGGNLSVQCHPTKEYIKNNFNENYTQEETYYILDTKEDGSVYLGFHEDINPEKFKEVLQHSFENNHPIDIEKYIQKLPTKRHDLFLIPPGTIHASGKNNLVLEISSTPYIYTFKMYDWVRPDLTGKLRPLNIERGFANLDFSKKGLTVASELICNPLLIESTDQWSLWHLPTHTQHLYDVHRIYLNDEIKISTDRKCHVMSLVQGNKIRIETQNGIVMVFHYAETFVIPAAAENYTIINENDSEAIIIKAFIK